jgi:hypothetical protein
MMDHQARADLYAVSLDEDALPSKRCGALGALAQETVQDVADDLSSHPRHITATSARLSLSLQANSAVFQLELLEKILATLERIEARGPTADDQLRGRGSA